jgi:voltage-gated potassium channel Kch
MSALLAAASILLILLTLIDAFEATVLPRQVMHRFRFVRFYYRTTWRFWGALAIGLLRGKRREAMLGWFGPLSLIGLFASWVLGLVFGFALLNWSLGISMHSLDAPAGESAALSLPTYLYWSGVTFFTLGYGDITPAGPLGRFFAVVETGTGFGFLAMVISYMPVLYQAFSRRETTISLMDARAGSPPSAGEVLIRLARAGNVAAADQLLAEWERWSAELLESHLSFPLLGYYRSQHDNQSWLAAVTTMLDTCTFFLAALKTNDPYRAQLTFAMARHAVVDLSLVLKLQSCDRQCHRLSTDQLRWLREQLLAAGVEMHEVEVAEPRLAALRAMYEPFVSALSRHLHLTLPAIVLDQQAVDNWQRSAWMPRAPGISDLAVSEVGEKHF